MKTKDGNSITNQQIKGDFIRREVLACFSYEMDAILAQEESRRDNKLPTWEDIENFYEYQCPECGSGYQDVKDFEALTEEEEAAGYIYKCPDCGYYFSAEPDQEGQEIFEWWIVSKYLYNRLKDKGQPVMDWGNNCYWGRCCTGQAILLDGIITEICEEMEILDGQVNSWAKKP